MLQEKLVSQHASLPVLVKLEILTQQNESASFFQVTLRSPKWRSLNPWKGHLKPPKGSLGRTWWGLLLFVFFFSSKKINNDPCLTSQKNVAINRTDMGHLDLTEGIYLVNSCWHEFRQFQFGWKIEEILGTIFSKGIKHCRKHLGLIPRWIPY